MRKLFFLIIFLVYNPCLFSAEPDSLKTISTQIIEDSSKVIYYLKLSSDKTYNFTDAVNYANYALNLSSKLNYLRGQANALNRLGTLWKYLGNYPKSIEYHLLELRIWQKLGDTHKIADADCSIGETYRANRMMNLALEYLNKALATQISIKDTLGQALALNRIAAINYELSEGDSVKLKSTVNNSTKSLELAFYLKNNGLISNNYNILGASYRMTGNFNKSLYYLFKSIEYMNTDSIKLDKPLVLINIAYCYKSMKKYSKAIPYAEESFQLAKKSGVNIYQRESAMILSQLYRELGNYQKAYDYLCASTNTHDAIYSKEKEDQIIAIHTKYELENKEKENEILRQKNHIRELEQNRLSTFLIILSVFTGLALILIYLIYQRNRSIRKINVSLKEKNNEIKNKNNILNDLNATKDKFFSIIAHDLRNPLSSFKQSIEIILSKMENLSFKELKINLAHLGKSADNVFSLLENLLVWSRSQRGIITYEPEQIDLLLLVKNTINFFSQNAAAKNIKVINSIEGRNFVWCDINMILTVLRNLLSNAIKFTFPNGKITLESKIVTNEISLNSGQSENASPDAFIEICIRDTGIGISDKDIAKLFRIDSAYSTFGTASEQGTGLGLILCKEFVERNGGIIRVESCQGEGSSFFFTLPRYDNI
ncbi:MAG: hypothetical protein HW421_509 [Ignavibacteria bacterium]|nr:hypothetical protein [Ignavibacteria bacterium]